MKTSDAINEIAAATAKAQAEMKPAIKRSNNPHFRSAYASIADVWESIRKPFTSNNITIWQDVETVDRGVSVTTRLVHSSGQWVEFGPLCVPMAKQDAQGTGSAVSYARRYALCTALGVVSGEEDDDGEEACSNHAPEPKYQPKPEPKPEPEKKPHPPEECITADQLVEFRKVWDKCSEDHRKIRSKILKNEPHRVINSLAEMPKNIYVTEMELAKLNAQLNQHQKEKENVDKNTNIE